MSKPEKQVRALLDQIAEIEHGVETLDSIMFSRRVVQNLVHTRRAAGMTQQDLAKATQIPLERIKEIEGTPFIDLRVSTLARYAHGCGAEYHMGVVETPPEPEDGEGQA